MISVVIPTRDEPYAQTLVDNINNEIQQEHEIIIVDKSSVTPTIRGAKVVTQQSSGLGNAILEGLKKAKGDVIAILDGDGSHDPSDLKKMLEK